ncbi:MAG: molybdopterin-dependent oxidoreductase [Halobacteriaceae archaeon]
MARIALPPRLTDWTLLLVVGVSFATGLLSLVAGTPGEWWVFVVHGVAGLTLVVLLAWKLRRVWPRLRAAGRDRSVALSALLTVIAVGSLATGVGWVSGVEVSVLRWNLLNVHVLFGLLLVAVLPVHLAARLRPPDPDELDGRRSALGYAALGAFGASVWLGQRALNRLRGTAGVRRFTGSRERGTEPGNTFPVTTWMADDPDPIDVSDWSLTVAGAVEEPLDLAAEALEPADALRATLDCTSGWYTVQDWQGRRVGDLLDRAGPAPGATHVRFVSVTGYRWTLPMAEARDALLATHVGGERLTHGRGFPLRLVAPGRRGFQWVKWVERVEVRRGPDHAQWVVIFTSGFD